MTKLATDMRRVTNDELIAEAKERGLTVVRPEYVQTLFGVQRGLKTHERTFGPSLKDRLEARVADHMVQALKAVISFEQITEGEGANETLAVHGQLTVILPSPKQ